MGKQAMQHQEPHVKAIIAHGLMLLNLLFPVLTYLFLALYWFKNRNTDDNLFRIAINQAFIAGTISTIFFVLANLIILAFAQYKSTFALITFEVYFVFIVPIFLIPGFLGLVKSNANLIYYYPIVGNRFK